MARVFYSSILVLAFVISFDRPSAQAQISRENPYRSFNISGVNYGSMRWEEQHRGQTQSGRTLQSLQPAPQSIRNAEYWVSADFVDSRFGTTYIELT